MNEFVYDEFKPSGCPLHLSCGSTTVPSLSLSLSLSHLDNMSFSFTLCSSHVFLTSSLSWEQEDEERSVAMSESCENKVIALEVFPELSCEEMSLL